MGRAARKRRQKKQSSVQSGSLCHQLQYVTLMKFLHGRGFHSTLLQPALFSDTGRGLRALRSIKPGELVISLPESCLLTSSTVLSSYLGQFIKSWPRRLSALSALCVFLVAERHRGQASHWFPYIGTLPASYTCPACFGDDAMALLPPAVRRRGEEQREAVRELHASGRDFCRSLQPILSKPAEEVFTYEALRWAWCSVNTRSVFMSQPPNNFLSGQDVYALAPFLDLLNHQPDLQVEASFDEVTRCYQIRSVSGTRPYQQAFINYGSHDNQRLLLEYGFVAPGNPHSVVYVESDLLRDVLRGNMSLEQKIKFLQENNLLHNLTVSSDGPSWRLMTALRLLSMPQSLYHQWKDVSLGQAVCEEREEWSVRAARMLCQRLLQDTHTALDKISVLLQQCDQSAREHLHVVMSLRREERCILGRCLDVLRGTAAPPDPIFAAPT